MSRATGNTSIGAPAGPAGRAAAAPARRILALAAPLLAVPLLAVPGSGTARADTLVAQQQAAPRVPSLPASPEQPAAPGLPPSVTGVTPSPANPAAQAAASATPATVTIPPLFSSAWFDGVKYGAQVEGGFTFNGDRPMSGLNDGQLVNDHANQGELNQVLLTIQRATDPKATDYDFGFAFQALYGSDARFYHFVGELDRSITDRYQLGIIQANVSAHLPWLVEGGIDAKAGQFPTPLGFETIDPSTNAFYSHSYIFNFGLPFLNTGVLATAHVNDTIDVWGGVVSGNQTTLGANSGDNNGAPAGVFGLGLNNLLGGKLTVLALSQIGAENPSSVYPNANGSLRYFNDLVLTYKATDKLTFVTEGNYIRDDYFHAEGYGAAQYVSYALSDQVTLNGRAEVWRDNNGFYVTRYPGNLDAINAIEGRPNTSSALGKATYSEFTAGLTYKPTLPKPISLLMIRPELRFDEALNGARPFNGGRDHGYFTASIDAVLGF